MLQFEAYLMIIIDACINVTLVTDVVLARGIIHKHNTFMIQAAEEIVTYNRKLRS